MAPKHFRKLRIEVIHSNPTISGYIIFQALKSFELERIKVQLKVHVRTNLVVRKQDSKNEEDEILKQSILCRDNQARGRDERFIVLNSRNVRFRKGDHGRFRFDFPRNYNLPGFFKHDHGSVRYRVTAFLYSQLGNSEEVRHRVCGFFEPSTYISLPKNLCGKGYRLVLKDVKLQIKEDLEVEMLGTSQLEVTVTAKNKGYLPGERIALNVRIVNPTNCEVLKIEICLFQNVSIKVKQFEKVFEEIIADSTVFPHLEDGEADYEQFLLIPAGHRVPDVSYYFRTIDKIIEVSYSLKTRVITSSIWKPEIESPRCKILLGTHREIKEEAYVPIRFLDPISEEGSTDKSSAIDEKTDEDDAHSSFIKKTMKMIKFWKS